jgi:hypothetical protein
MPLPAAVIYIYETVYVAVASGVMTLLTRPNRSDRNSGQANLSGSGLWSMGSMIT